MKKILRALAIVALTLPISALAYKLVINGHSYKDVDGAILDIEQITVEQTPTEIIINTLPLPTDGKVCYEDCKVGTVVTNSPPVFSGAGISNTSVAANSSTVVGNILATDADNDVLAYTITSGATKFKLVGAELQFLFTQTNTGSHSVTIKVEDSNGASVSKTFTITVTTGGSGGGGGSACTFPSGGVELQANAQFRQSNGFQSANIIDMTILQTGALFDMNVNNIRAMELDSFGASNALKKGRFTVAVVSQSTDSVEIMITETCVTNSTWASTFNAAPTYCKSTTAGKSTALDWRLTTESGAFRCVLDSNKTYHVYLKNLSCKSGGGTGPCHISFDSK